MPGHLGAIIQGDGKSYAVSTRIPAGVVTPEQLETIAGVARKFQVPVVKLTSGQRVVLAGVRRDDVKAVMTELGDLAKPETAPCVRFTLACLGAGMCRYAKQDAVGLAKALEETFQDAAFPAKVKVGVSGCERCCCASHTRDIGVIASKNGWTVYFGGNGGKRPRFGDLVARDLSDMDVADCVARLAGYYRDHARPGERTARFMERTGMGRLRSEFLSLLPYIPLEQAK